MKKCECGACKWKTVFSDAGIFCQCLKCYKTFTYKQMKRLKDK